MIAEIGNFLLIVVLLVSVIQIVVSFRGAAQRDVRMMSVGLIAAKIQFFLVAIGFSCLMWLFWSNDFSVLNVAQNSNSALPWYYRLTATWGSHEGSLLLWILMLTGWMYAVSVRCQHMDIEMLSRVIGVMSFVALGFHLFLLFMSNPFERLIPAAIDGQDLNPLLQDPGMIIHPPMLYMGYVGFSVVFAFAIAALMGGQLNATWAHWSRPWGILAWSFLTIGIALGSWWAYYELGWGGWWFWDPVENASFMPWLTGTALIHSLIVTEKRGSFRAWAVGLAIITFSLSLLGTFLVRSGVITSVHAFATDPGRGIFILVFLAVVIGLSLFLFARQAPKIKNGNTFSAVSRETALLGNNVIFVSAAVAVLIGTLYPLFLDALALQKISVGPPYFVAVFVPIMTPAIFLMAIGPLLKWKYDKELEEVKKLKWAAFLTVSSVIGLALYVGFWSASILLGFLMSLWVISSVGVVLVSRLKKICDRDNNNLWMAIHSLSRSFYGMVLAHLGVGIFIAGVTVVSGYGIEKDVRLEFGESIDVAGYTFRFDSVVDGKGPNYLSKLGTITVLQDDRVETVLHPEKRFYPVQQMPMTEAAIDAGFLRDLYVSLGEPVGETTWILRVYYKPLVDWIWGGAALMALGGFFVATDRRYRRQKRQNINTK